VAFGFPGGWCGTIARGPHDPRRLLKPQEHGRPVAVRDSGVDRGRPDASMTQMILDELQGHAGVKQVGRD